MRIAVGQAAQTDLPVKYGVSAHLREGLIAASEAKGCPDASAITPFVLRRVAIVTINGDMFWYFISACQKRSTRLKTFVL